MLRVAVLVCIMDNKRLALNSKDIIQIVFFWYALKRIQHYVKQN